MTAPSPAVPGESEERRAVVQGLSAPSWDPKRKPPGTIAWSEHEAAWEGYRRAFPGSAAIQDAQRIHDRGRVRLLRADRVPGPRAVDLGAEPTRRGVPVSGGESVDRLRQAAAQMRALAEGCASGGPWRARLHDGRWQVVDEDCDVVADCPDYDTDNAYIAAMHPAVALAVADWLDETARMSVALYDRTDVNKVHVAAALAVADAFLGSL